MRPTRTTSHAMPDTQFFIQDVLGYAVQASGVAVAVKGVLSSKARGPREKTIAVVSDSERGEKFLTMYRDALKAWMASLSQHGPASFATYQSPDTFVVNTYTVAVKQDYQTAVLEFEGKPGERFGMEMNITHLRNLHALIGQVIDDLGHEHAVKGKPAN